MNLMQKIKLIIPFIILFSLLGLLWHELYSAESFEIPSTLIGDPVPNFQLPYLDNPQKQFTQNDLRGHVSLLNVWASWCSACEEEHAMLMKITNKYHVPLYGISYKDNVNDAKDWLRKRGNPYIIDGNDNTGNVAIDFGVYGTPETFVISPDGQIIYRYVGAIDQSAWDTVIYPMIQKYR